MASPVETQQAFLEGHVLAFDWFGGVFAEVRYDNLRSAVKKVLRGRRRVETDRFVAMRSHYLFESFFTTPGIEGAHEKGGVEGEVGRFRRNHLVPVPAVGSIGQLNLLLAEATERDLGRQITGRPVTVAEQLALERPLLRALPAAFDPTETTTVRVDSKALVTVRQNRYSVPVALGRVAGRRSRSARPRSRVMHRDREVARHERLHGRSGTRASLDHYLELLARKPGALARSLPLAQERDRGDWPGTSMSSGGAARPSGATSEAARQMVDVLMLCREHGPATSSWLSAARWPPARSTGGRWRCSHVATTPRRAGFSARGPRSEAPGPYRPEPDLSGYDQLIGGAR